MDRTSGPRFTAATLGLGETAAVARGPTDGTGLQGQAAAALHSLAIRIVSSHARARYPLIGLCAASVTTHNVDLPRSFDCGRRVHYVRIACLGSVQSEQVRQKDARTLRSQFTDESSCSAFGLGQWSGRWEWSE